MEIFNLAANAFCCFQVGGQIVGNAVGGDVLADNMALEARDDGENVAVKLINLTSHILFKTLNSIDVARPGNNLDTGFAADVIPGDQSAGMFRLKGIHNAQVDILLAQSLCGLGVDGFHPEIGKLVRHIVIGATNGHGIVGAYHQGVGTAEMVFLVNDGLPGCGKNSDAAECHFAVAAFKGRHQALLAVGVTGHDGQFGRQVDPLKGFKNSFVQR